MARTGSDSWDLASSVGATATMVAAYRAAATKAAEPVINDPFAEPLVRAVGIDFFSRLAGGELNVTDAGADELVSGMTNVFASRTRFFDGFVADAAAAGIRQTVIVASGLDARPYRLSWPSGSTVYEIDQPEVMDFKADTLAKLGATPTTDRRVVGIDLRQDWPTALRRAGFDGEQPTAWLAEGLLIGFLPPAAQDRLLDDITDLSASGSRFAGDYVSSVGRSEAMQERMRGVTDRWRDHGVDIDMEDLTYQGDRNDVADYLEARGWDAVRASITDLFAASGLPPIAGGDLEDAFGWIVFVSATRR
jgi:methyltransferase (TIGR00027 family)